MSEETPEIERQQSRQRRGQAQACPVRRDLVRADVHIARGAAQAESDDAPTFRREPLDIRAPHRQNNNSVHSPAAGSAGVEV